MSSPQTRTIWHQITHTRTLTNYLKTKTQNNNTRMNTYMGTVCNENTHRDMVCWMHHFQGNSNKTARNKKLNVNFHHFIHPMMKPFSRKDIQKLHRSQSLKLWTCFRSCPHSPVAHPYLLLQPGPLPQKNNETFNERPTVLLSALLVTVTSRAELV